MLKFLKYTGIVLGSILLIAFVLLGTGVGDAPEPDYTPIVDPVVADEDNGYFLYSQSLEELLGDGTDEAAIRITKSGRAVAYMNNVPPTMPDIAERNIRAEFIHHRADGAMLAELGALYKQGVLPLPQTETLPLESAVEAHLRSESRRTRGKLVLSINDL